MRPTRRGGQQGQQGQQGGQQGAQQGAQQGGQQGEQMVFNELQGIQGPFGRFRGESVNICNEERAPSNVRELLEHIPLEAMMIENWVQKRLVLVGDNQPLDKALARLNRHKISSIPIINEANGNIKGLLHSLDVVNYLSELLSAEPLQPARWDFNLQTTSTLLGKSQSKTMVISNTATMYDALQEFAKGTQRLMVVDQQCELHQQQQEEQGILGLFTQSDVLHFFGSNPYWLNMLPKSQQSLQQLLNGQYTEKVVTIEQTAPTMTGFQKISDSNSSGIAVVDSDGRIVANLSATNIRGISRRNFQLLNRPLFEFLQRDRRRGWWTMPITIRHTDTLEKAVLQFCATKVHQLYIVDNEGKPSAVVTPTDLLKHFIESQNSVQETTNRE